VAWTSPRTWAAGELVTASLMNAQLKNNLLALEAGRVSITSQAVGDFFIASSSTDMGREPASAIFPLVSPLTTRGDLLVASSGTVTGARLAVGSAGTLMASDGTDAAWSVVTSTVLQKTAAYTATTGDCGVDCTIKCSMTSGGAAFTIGLYAASGNSGRRLTVIKETDDVHIVTVDGNASHRDTHKHTNQRVDAARPLLRGPTDRRRIRPGDGGGGGSGTGRAVVRHGHSIVG
jgi:hypothetical protein